jgi:hypothetical protein
VLVIGQDNRCYHRDNDYRCCDRSSDDGQRPATTGLLSAAFQLPFEFALGRRTSLFVGRHRRCPSVVVC